MSHFPIAIIIILSIQSKERDNLLDNSCNLVYATYVVNKGIEVLGRKVKRVRLAFFISRYTPIMARNLSWMRKCELRSMSLFTRIFLKGDGK